MLAPASALDDDMDFFLGATTKKPVVVAAAPLPVILQANQGGNGLQISGAFRRRNGNIFLDLSFANMSPAALSDFAIQFNKNAYGVAPLAALQVPSPVMPGSTATAQLLCGFTTQPQASPNADIVQIALKTTAGVVYFQTEFGFQNYLIESGEIPKQSYQQLWMSIADSEQKVSMIDNVSVNAGFGVGAADVVLQKLQRNNVFVVARKSGAGGDETLYLSGKTAAQGSFMFELLVHSNNNNTVNVKMTAKGTQPVFLPACEKAFANILRSN